MKKIFILSILLVSGFILTSCSDLNTENSNSSSIETNLAQEENEKSTFKNITPLEASERLRNEESIVLLDVRTEE